MNSAMWFDSYERRARITPGLILLLPIPIVIAALGLRDNAVVVVIVSLLSVAGGPLLLATHVRLRGLAAQERLYAAWGGPPTTLLLAPASASPPGPLQSARREDTQRASGRTLPSWQDAQQDPRGAAEEYQAAVAVLRTQTTAERKRYFLVFHELRNYGFVRNLLGVRTEALCLCAIAGAALAVAIVLERSRDGASLHLVDLVMAALAVVALTLFWALWPRGTRVKRVGMLYAERLFEAAATL
jgi:hypothetical protein